MNIVSIWKKTFGELIRILIVVSVILWTAHVINLLCRGMMHEAFNEIIMLNLVVLCYVATQRMERLANLNAALSEEVQRLADIEVFVQALRDMASQREAEQQVAEKNERTSGTGEEGGPNYDHRRPL